MTPSVPTDYTDATEDAIREEVLEGLGRAVNEEIEEDKRRALTETEQEKLLYFAVKEFDLPVTYSWYLAGAKANAHEGSANVFIDAPNTPPEPSIDDGERLTGTPESVEEYKMYFLETTFFADYTLRNVNFTGKTEFLCDFYEHECSDKYKDLYIASAKFRGKLEDAVDKAWNRIDSQETVTPILSHEEERELKDLLTTIQIELLQIDGLNHCREAFKNGVDEIEAAITALSNTPTITDDQHELLEDIEDYYYETVWKYPALKISAETVTGPAAPDVRKHRLSRFKTFEKDTLYAETDETDGTDETNKTDGIEDIRDRRREEGLVASISGFEESTDSLVMQEAYSQIAEQAGGD